jgi:hypothetical protein
LKTEGPFLMNVECPKNDHDKDPVISLHDTNVGPAIETLSWWALSVHVPEDQYLLQQS